MNVQLEDARVDGIIDVVTVTADVPPLVDCSRDRHPCPAIVSPVAVVPLVMLGIGCVFPVIAPPPHGFTVVLATAGVRIAAVRHHSPHP